MLVTEPIPVPGGFSANRDKQVLCRDFNSKNEPEIFSLGALDHAPAAVVVALKGAALTSSLLWCWRRRHSVLAEIVLDGLGDECFERAPLGDSL